MVQTPKAVEIRPQAGPQYQFLASTADITIYGGAAGGGKTYGLLIDAARHIEKPLYRAAIFRREIAQITLQGGLMDEAQKLYPGLDGKVNLSARVWTFRSGASVAFHGCEHEGDRFKFQGAQFGYLGFDELTHFTQTQFWYLWSRLRSVAGVRPRLRATCNPDPDSWVKDLIRPWLEGERAPGEVIWLRRDGDDIVPSEPREEGSFSLTFIPARLTDNQILMEADPEYLRKLQALPYVERRALLEGSWDQVLSGDFFNPAWWQYIDQVPKIIKKVRFWDLAATRSGKGKGEGEDPDWTVGVLMGLTESNQVVVLDVIRVRETPARIEEIIKAAAARDGRDTQIIIEQEGGSSGKIVGSHFSRNILAGYQFMPQATPRMAKAERAKPFASAVENQNVFLPSGLTWVNPFVNELARFPDPKIHDDQVDAASGAYSNLILTPRFGAMVGRPTHAS